ncbi:MAG: hypothetical protein ABI747_02490 [Candidatus Moraniibacteriota bacterium]
MKNIFIISGPAGSGKDAVIQELGKLLPFERVITSTTRPIRPGETEGKPYHFLSREGFEKKIAQGDFVEHSTNENNELYGVTREELERVSKSELFTLWKLDWKGVVSAKELFPTIQALLITAPLPVLESRLRKRDGATRGEEYFQERMGYTQEWLKHTDIYDFIIENEEGKLDETVQKVRTLIEEKLAH